MNLLEKKYYWKSLSITESNFFKGLAILMIVGHNFMHLFPAPRENEFSFSQENADAFFHLVISDPENMARHLLSFLGHFGVQIFIFLSAYGLARKYTEVKFGDLRFLGKRVMKIYPAFLLTIVFWAIHKGWITEQLGILGPAKVLYWNLKDLLLKIFPISNLIPGQELSPVGPWWFIPFIIQFYLAYPLLLLLFERAKGYGLALLAVAGIGLTTATGGNLGGINIFFTPFGHLPELCLGIYLAKTHDEKIGLPRVAVLLVLLVFFLGLAVEWFWYFNHLSALILMLIAFSGIYKRTGESSFIRTFILFIGGISMHLFLVNGFLREPFISWATDYNQWLTTLLLCLGFIAISIAVAFLLHKSDILLRQGLALAMAKRS